MTRAATRGDSGGSDTDTDPELEALLRHAARISSVSASPPLPKTGSVVGGRYRIDARLGRGGMGAVFRATHIVSQKPVALKWLLRPDSDTGARARFLREARAAGRVDHPNVVDVYDVGQEGPGWYLVMELLHGESLHTRLKRGSLTIAAAVDLLLPAMRGVAAVHRAGVIHRDLKPDNIFLCRGPDGQPREAKVLDFGISALRTAEHTDSTLTADGMLLGTPAYMSPEQLQSARVDPRSDIFALGVILYEAFTGKLPFDAESYSGLVLAVVHDEPTPPRVHQPELPKQLEAIVLRALAKRRTDRFPTIESLIDAIAPFGSEAPAARELEPKARLGRTRWMAAGFIALALVTAFVCGRRLDSERPAPVPRVETPAIAPSPVEPARDFDAPPAAGSHPRRLGRQHGDTF